MAENPKEVLERLPRTVKQDAERRIKSIVDDKCKVFYYPACGSDLEPVKRLAHLFESFVFCDYKAVREDWTKESLTDERRGLMCEGVFDLDPATVAQLSNEEHLPWPVDHQWRPVLPWGKLFILIRNIAGMPRHIPLLYLGIEAVTAYHNLFTTRGRNASAICFKRCIGLGAANWTQFTDWNQHLGQLAQRHDPWPTFLFAKDNNRGDWPMTQLWQRFHNWEDCPKAYVLPDHQRHPIHANPLGGARRVIVRRGTLTPEAVAGCDAIVLPIDLYIKHVKQWPVAAKILLLAPPDQGGRLAAREAGLDFLGSKRVGLGRLLQSITQVCQQHSIRRISSIGIGYEDEGPKLDRWRQQAGVLPELELTIYCQTEGDVLSLGPYADQIE